MAHTVILAAGEGSRMGNGAKCLLPVQGPAGTLDLLLRWCGPDSTVVYGAAEIAEHVAACWPGVRLCHNPAREAGLLGSLAVGIEDLRPQPLRVLLADTVYLSGARAVIDAWDSTTTTVPVQPRKPAEIGVKVVDEHVTALGDGFTSEFVTASAVLWAADEWEVIGNALAHGFTRQADALDAAIADGLRVAAIEVAPDSVFDVDTPKDLKAARDRLAPPPV